MSHFWEAFLSEFLTVSMTMIPVTCWGVWADFQRMVTCF